MQRKEIAVGPAVGQDDIKHQSLTVLPALVFFDITKDRNENCHKEKGDYCVVLLKGR